jgi:hypothetical protein
MIIKNFEKALKHFDNFQGCILFKGGKYVGKICAYWTTTNTRRICHAYVWIGDGNAETFTGWGKAGGSGYDGYSAAVYEALQGSGYHVRYGAGTVKQELEAQGLTIYILI